MRFCYMELAESDMQQTIKIRDMAEINQYRKELREYHSKECEERSKFFATGVKEGLFRPDLNYEVLSEVGHVTMEEIMHRQLYRTYSMQELFDNYTLTVIRGFCTERGLMELDRALTGL